jgi:hypothetical protein
MPNNKVHLTYKALQSVQRGAGESYMPGGYVYQYMLPARVQPGNSIMHKSIMDRMKDGKGPGMVLYLGH